MDDLLLLQYVSAVAKLADRQHPEQISQRAFDLARRDARYRDVPSAQVIARRLGKPWREVLTLAHSPTRSHSSQLSSQSADGQGWLTAEHIAYAMKLVARRLQTATLSVAQYDTEREQLLKEHRRQHPRSTRLRMPTSAQICTFTGNELRGAKAAHASQDGSWPRALELAGLIPNRKPVRRRAPARDIPVELLERYHETHGHDPTPARLAKFAREQGIQHETIRNKTVWEKALRSWHKDREQRGQPTSADPPAATGPEQRLAALNFRKTSTLPTTRWADKSKCVLVVRRYLQQVPRGELATLDGYERWARNQTGPTPPVGALERHGGWDAIRVLAHKQMMKTTIKAVSKT